jgi:hypothetical protein
VYEAYASSVRPRVKPEMGPEAAAGVKSAAAMAASADAGVTTPGAVRCNSTRYPHVRRKRAERRATRDATVDIRSATVGAAIVVYEGLGKVVAVGKRSAGDGGAPRVDRVDCRLAIALSVPLPELHRELNSQVLDQGVHLLVDLFPRVEIVLLINELLLGLGDEPRAFHPRPGTQPCERGLNITSHGEPLDRGIDPAFNRNVGGRHIGGVAACISVPWRLGTCLGVPPHHHEEHQQEHR